MKILPWVQDLGRNYLKRPMNALTDEELVRAMDHEDHLAFEVFYQRHKAGLYFFLMRFLGRSDLCEEVMQEAFLKFHQNRSSFNPLLSKARTWLYNIARNTAIDGLRKKGEVLLEDEEWEVASVDEGLEEKLISEAQREDLRKAILELVPSQREAILLWMQEMSYEEMAQVTGKSAQAMKNLVNRARAGLVNLEIGSRYEK